MAAATSAGFPNRPRGWRSLSGWYQLGSLKNGAVIGVSITPGHTQLTRTLGAHVTAMVRVRFTTPPFDAAYAGDMEPPTRPKMEAILVTDPPAAAASWGSAAREARYVPLRFTWRTRSHSSGSGVASRRAALTPAELTRVVMRPNRPSAVSTIRPQLPSLVTSTSRETASPPALPICSAVSCAPSPLASAHRTRAPSMAMRKAVARPMPEPAPVTMTTLSFIRMARIVARRRELRQPLYRFLWKRRGPGQRFRPYGQRGDLDAERLHGVGHGIGDGGGGADGAAFAHALVPPRRQGRRRLEVAQGERRHVARRGQRIVHEASREELSAGIIDELLAERFADALGDRAVPCWAVAPRLAKVPLPPGVSSVSG